MVAVAGCVVLALPKIKAFISAKQSNNSTEETEETPVENNDSTAGDSNEQ
jgi:hypothetical protein